VLKKRKKFSFAGKPGASLFQFGGMKLCNPGLDDLPTAAILIPYFI